MSDPLIGQTIGRYEIVDRIGQGGMGVVYRGRQMSLNRTVAVKFLPMQMAVDDEFVQRFRQEAEVIASLAHENIVYVYDIDQHQHTWYIVMEFIDGHSLRELRGAQAFSADEVRALGIPLARALDYAHQRGIIHRDIKSANVMVTQEGKVKLMDFGIAKAAGSGVKTITGSVLGTPEYMSPEQARSGKVTPQSDVYSLGVLLYELAAGSLPFRADDPFAVALKHVSEEPEPPSARNAAVPDWMEGIILRAMAKDPAERYASAGELEHELLRAGADSLADPTGARLTSEAPTLTRSLNTVAPATGPAAESAPPPPPPPPSTPPPSHTTVPQAVAASGQGATIAESPPGATPPPFSAPGTTPPPSVPTTPGAAPSSAPPFWRTPAALGLLAALVLVAIGAGWWFSRGTTPSPSTTTAAAPNPAPEVPVAVAPGTGPALRVPGAPEGASPPDLTEEQKLQVEVGLLLDRGESLLASGDAAGALEVAEQALGMSPENERALALRDAARAVIPSPKPSPEPAPTPNRTPGSTSPAWGEAPASPPPEPTFEKPAGPSVDELWRRADREYDDENYHSCRDTLDQILAIDPHHRKARKWRSEADDWVREGEAEVRDELESWMEEFVDTVQDQDFGDIQVIWGQKYLDSRTAQYFRDLFEKYKRIKVDVDLRSVEIRDHEARFEANVQITGRKTWRGDPENALSKTWKGTFRLVDGDPTFVSAFP